MLMKHLDRLIYMDNCETKCPLTAKSLSVGFETAIKVKQTAALNNY